MTIKMIISITLACALAVCRAAPTLTNTIMSDNHPKPYGAIVSKRWDLQVSQGQVMRTAKTYHVYIVQIIEMTFGPKFDVEQSPNKRDCYDSVRIYDAKADTLNAYPTPCSYSNPTADSSLPAVYMNTCVQEFCVAMSVRVSSNPSAVV
jgi:hypothetical protein